MSNKRFTSEYYSVGYYTEIVDNEKILEDVPNPQKNLTIKECVDLLNELAEENKQLKTKNNAYIQDIEVYKEENTHLKLENEMLKSELESCRECLELNRESCARHMKENEELKEEVELLREGLNAYENNLPTYLTCREIRDFNSDLFEFKIKQQNFYNEHPNRCKIIVDGVDLND